MTTSKSPSEKLKELRDEHAKKIAEFDADQARRIEEIRLENEARIAAEEAVAKAAAEEFDKAEKAAENAFKEAEAKKKAAQKLSDQHVALFGKPPSKDKDSSDDTDEGVASSLKNWVSKLWGWVVFLAPRIFKLLILAIIAWILVWAYFGIANFMGNAANVGYVDTGAVSDPESTVVPTSTPEPTAVSESVVEQTAVPEPTVVEPTKSAPKPTAQKPKPTAVTVAPAIPVTWNSGETASYKPVAGMICHGDLIGPFGSSDGTRPVIVQFWSNQPEPLVMIWASCELNTGRSLGEIKAEIESKYSKTFEVVNN
jgi:hypothetical protein